MGDRYLTKIVLDGYNNQVELHVNLISRIRSDSGEWNYYSEGDIENGILVFSGISKISFDESELIPNDQIYEIKVSEIDTGIYKFTIETSHVDENSLTHDLVFTVIGQEVFHVNPKKPNDRITD